MRGEPTTSAAFRTSGGTRPRVSLAVVPKAQFGFATTALDALLKHTRQPCELIYVDGGSPPKVREHIRRRSEEHGFRVIEGELMAPPEARNLALEAARGEFVAYIENDVLVRPGWLEKLVLCADETGADVVFPLVLWGGPLSRIVHFAGGECQIADPDGERRIFTTMVHAGKPVSAVRDQLRREQTGQTEFHALLIRRSLLDRIGPFDERISGASDGVDFNLALKQAGGRIFIEPEAEVTFVTEIGWTLRDRVSYLVRWSREWERNSAKNLREKWKLGDSRHFHDQAHWLISFRHAAVSDIQRALRPVVGSWPASNIANNFERLLTWTLVRRELRKHRKRQEARRQQPSRPEAVPLSTN